MDLTKLLQYIPASALEYQEWINVGMALKHEGYSCDVWDAWSSSDTRYKAGECARKWTTFREGTANIVTGGTIHDLATRFGYVPQGRDVRAFEWDDEIEYDGTPDVIIKDAAWLDTSVAIETPKTVGADDLRRFIQALFKPDDIVGFCVDAELDGEKWKPSTKGVYGMTAKQILASIKKHPDDIEETIGDYNREAGAWIRFNPLDGEGVSNNNVTDLRYALVESDNLELEKQKALIEELKLPVAVMTYSGGKSIHAIVKIDAITEQDYREKVDYLYRVCEKNGLSIDKQNKNQSRMTRMPGVIRGEKKQFIIAEGIGCKDFDEWKEYIEDSIDNLPEIVSFSDLGELPPLSPELIEGVLRKGHKMLISGASKAGKSFLLIELAIRISTGGKWLGFQCSKGKVLYVNLEVDSASFLHRIADVQERMGIKTAPGIDVWNLRGENAAIDKLTPRLIHRARNKDYAAIILDPLYKINLGDENSASEMAKFFNQLDMICTKLNTSIICCHHHSKGAQGGKFSIDRASGSGVFARDPDAVLDMIQLNPRDAGFSLEDKSDTAWRVSATLREFKTPEPVDVIFHYPLHEITDDLKDAKPMSGQDSVTNSKRGNDVKSGKMHEKYDRLLAFVENWDEIDTKQPKTPHPTIAEAVEYFKTDSGYSERSIRRWIENNEDAFIQGGLIILNDQEVEK
jgi:RecA-family ATPase